MTERAEKVPTWKRVFHRYWWTLGWHNRFHDEAHVTWSLCLSNFNRPIIRWDLGEGCRFFSIEWGNGNSDPAWSIGWQGRLQ